jgi:predicted  nucleic acid-binding Zn ribbon protein
MKCVCCGGEMLLDKELEKTVFYKCKECGLSNTELKKSAGR